MSGRSPATVTPNRSNSSKCEGSLKETESVPLSCHMTNTESLCPWEADTSPKGGMGRKKGGRTETPK